MAPTLIAVGLLVVLIAVGIAVWPVLSADINRSVQRGLVHQGEFDVTAVTLMVFGLSLIGAVGIASAWLGANWS